MGDASGQASDRVLRSEFQDDPDMAELIGLFLDELGPRVESMRGAWEVGDAEGLKRIAHQIKGAAGGYGYPSISRAAQRLEASLSHHHADALSSARGALDELIDLCRSAIHGRV
jgi:HPt (histidine-containing phosphotransfer) domain-containing protein